MSMSVDSEMRSFAYELLLAMGSKGTDSIKGISAYELGLVTEGLRRISDECRRVEEVSDHGMESRVKGSSGCTPV